MIADIHPTVMGAHALMSYESRMHALEEFGINMKVIQQQDTMKSLVKEWRQNRELLIQEQS